MELNNILEEVLQNPKTLEVISKQVGLDKKNTKGEIAKALPLLLEGLEKNIGDSSKKELLVKAIEKKHSGELLENIEKIDLSDGEKIINHIFGDKKNDIEKKVGNPGVLKALGPIVLASLGKQAKLKNTGVSEILGLFSGSSKGINGVLVAFLDKDGDGDIKDDIFKMILNWIKKNFFQKK